MSALTWKIGAGVIAYLVVGLLLFLGAARWGHEIRGSTRADMLRDILAVWPLLLLMVPLSIAVDWCDDRDYTFRGLADRLYEFARSSSQEKPNQ